MTMHVKDATVWKPASLSVRDAGVWKPAVTGSIRDSVWKVFLASATYAATLNTTSGSEPFTVAISVATTGVASGAFLTYQIVAANGSAWAVDDYDVSNGYDNSKPVGNITVDGTGNAYLDIVINAAGYEGYVESTEYFYVNFFAGYNADVNEPPVAQTQIITVNNLAAPASCPWVKYGMSDLCP